MNEKTKLWSAVIKLTIHLEDRNLSGSKNPKDILVAAWENVGGTLKSNEWEELLELTKQIYDEEVNGDL